MWLTVLCLCSIRPHVLFPYLYFQYSGASIYVSITTHIDAMLTFGRFGRLKENPLKFSSSDEKIKPSTFL